MKYEKLTVKRFIRETKAGNIDLNDFYSKFFERSRKLNKKYNFFVALAEDVAIKEARKIRKENKNKKLLGLPVSVKDCICTKGINSTAGSKILSGYISPFDSTAVSRIKKEGGVIVGKTNQDEFGFGTFSVNSGYSIPRNPFDPERSCGGSSGGAGGFCRAIDFPHIALAESTGGSISCPASFCGVVGLTPSYGLVSRYGLIDYANSLDKIGAIGKTVVDVALMLSVITGFDPEDSTSINKKKEDYSTLKKDIRGLKIGVPKEYFEGIDEKIADCIWKGIKKLESLGATYRKISLSSTKYALPAYYIIATAEASTNLARYSGMRYGVSEKIQGNFNEYFSFIRTKYFGPEAKRRILLGTYSRLAGFRDRYYLKAMKVRTLIINEFKRHFKKYDILITPTMPIIAPRFNQIEKMSPLKQYLMDTLTVAPNLAGIPMLSIPCGSVDGMPVGMHILGDHLKERLILNVGYNLEK